MSATVQARLLASKELSAAELVNLYLRRIADHDEQIAAFTCVAPKRARWAAQRWDRERRRNRQPQSPLSGVPTGIKDLAIVRGMPTGLGTRSIPTFISPVDGFVAKRLRASGMIIAGKLSTSEFGAMPVTEPDTHPPTRNPFNLEHTAGGSSGGSGAAVAAGLLPIAQGSDGAGSIRIPSALGHLLGMKVTRNRIACVSPPDRELRLAEVGGLARTVEDLAAFLDLLLKEPGLQDCYDHALPRGLRVGLSTESPLCETEASYQEAARRVATILEDQGASLNEAPWFDIASEDFLTLWKRLMANAPWLMESKLQPVTAWLRNEGKTIGTDDALRTRKRLQQGILSWFGETDIWVSPTVAIKPPKIGAWQAPTAEQSFLNILGLGVYTAGFNVSGQPAISIPMGLDDQGLPIGVQLAARPGAEALLLQAAYHIEQVVDGFCRPLPEL